MLIKELNATDFKIAEMLLMNAGYLIKTLLVTNWMSYFLSGASLTGASSYVVNDTVTGAIAQNLMSSHVCESSTNNDTIYILFGQICIRTVIF